MSQTASSRQPKLPSQSNRRRKLLIAASLLALGLGGSWLAGYWSISIKS
ncbi:MAG: hypothetical protein HC934_10255 [Acaryochloridaceae cyanobacterium SU_2_1]|nr:hypothetical protein [Acaryochloridaceae cyanobacterium SU_2_1]